MAFSLASRFPPPKELDECIFGPGAYQNQLSFLIPKNKAAFNSNASRDAGSPKPYTDQLYSPVLKRHIPNCTGFLSTKPRFPYEALSKEDIENLICRCSMDCDCPLEGEVIEPKKEVCQKKVPRKLIVGRPPRSIVKGGLVCKSVTSDTAVHVKRGEPDPPFYNTRVFETTTFYHGCKWSQRTAKRFQKTIEDSEVRPGPAAYTLEQKPRDDVICAEKIRFLCRKASKQPRLAEIIQNHELRHGGPGPAAYYPLEVKHNAVSVSGSRANRFATNKYDVTPGPADYTLKSKFDLPQPPTYFSRARLPEPSFFGTKAPRFKDLKQQIGPGPADYTVKGNLCKIQHCVEGAPFGTSAERFKAPKVDDDYEYEEYDEDEEGRETMTECKQPSWMFRSKSRRGETTPRPLEPKVDELPPERKYRNLFVKKAVHDEHIAPFQTSEGRFLPWNDWMSVYGRLDLPGPGTYSIDKPKCYHPAVVHGPLFRAPKTSFFSINEGPGPSERNISQGLDIKTFNLRLQKNEIKRANGFKWIPPKELRKLTLQEKESVLLNHSIALLDDLSVLKNKPSKSSISTVRNQKSNNNCHMTRPKLLRCFLGHQVHCR